jgi:hypothetical protein
LLRAIAGTAITFLVLAVSSAALGQEPDESGARLHFRTGASYYEAGEYADALREFERAYALSHRADLFYNLSLCHERLGDIEQAAHYLERFLAEAAEVPNRSNLEIRLAHFREQIEARALAAQQAAAERDARAEETPAPEVAPPTAPPAPAGPNVGAIASFSVAAAGVIGAAIFAPLAFAEDASLAGGCGATGSCRESDLDVLRAFTITTDVSLSIALAAAVLGTVLVLVVEDDPGSSERVAIRAVPFAGPTSAGLSIGGAL